jgi:exosortase
MSSASPNPRVTSRSGEPSLRWFTPLSYGLAALSVLFLPVIFPYLRQLWTREYYQFFPFAIASTLWFAVSRAAPTANLVASGFRLYLRAAAFAGAELALICGAWLGSPWVCFISFVVFFGLILDLFVEAETGRSLLYLLLPMLLIIRPPLSYDEIAIQKLQLLTTRISSDFLNTLHYEHIRQGNIIQPETGSALLVAEACSGVQSLFTLMFIASFIGIARQYPVVRSLLLVGTGVFWALLMNVCRVLAIAIAQIQFQVDLTTGWKHDVVGYAAMLLAIPFLLSTDKLILFVFDTVADDPRKHQKINVLVLAWNWLFGARASSVVSSGRRSSRRTETQPVGTEGELQSDWKKLPAKVRWTLIAAVMLVALTVIPTWILPGFLRGAVAVPAVEPQGRLHKPVAETLVAENKNVVLRALSGPLNDSAAGSLLGQSFIFSVQTRRI